MLLNTPTEDGRLVSLKTRYHRTGADWLSFRHPHELRFSGQVSGRLRPLRLRIGTIAGLFDRKSEYRIRLVACLFYEIVERYEE